MKKNNNRFRKISVKSPNIGQVTAANVYKRVQQPSGIVQDCSIVYWVQLLSDYKIEGMFGTL